jgi:hypothetical protein
MVHGLTTKPAEQKIAPKYTNVMQNEFDAVSPRA